VAVFGRVFSPALVLRQGVRTLTSRSGSQAPGARGRGAEHAAVGIRRWDGRFFYLIFKIILVVNFGENILEKCFLIRSHFIELNTISILM
jgi:hypothetical protein